jgi:tRNA threonylcarbamoyladenosine biosynthesis protein TsaE
MEHPLPDTALFTSHCTVASPDETAALGARAAKLLSGGEVILLWGPLGAGKTLFVQGLCRELGMTDGDVVSPTFTLVNTYTGPLIVHHLDLYRLGPDDDLHDLGLDTILEEVDAGGAVLLVEWPDPLLSWLDERLELFVEPGAGSDERTWHLRGVPKVSDTWSDLMEGHA